MPLGHSQVLGSGAGREACNSTPTYLGTALLPPFAHSFHARPLRSPIHKRHDLSEHRWSLPARYLISPNPSSGCFSLDGGQDSPRRTSHQGSEEPFPEGARAGQQAVVHQFAQCCVGVTGDTQRFAHGGLYKGQTLSTIADVSKTLDTTNEEEKDRLEGEQD